MLDKDKTKFLEWYEADKIAKGGLYDFQKEFIDYCRMDVTVLRLCCQQFRKLFCEISDGLDPFVAAITIAGVCSVYWRTFDLEDNQIGIISRAGKNRKQSKLAIRYLEWVEHDSGRPIEHAANGQEHKIGNYFVDGYEADHDIVHEVHGC
jgi:hypothetical protein